MLWIAPELKEVGGCNDHEAMLPTVNQSLIVVLYPKNYFMIGLFMAAICVVSQEVREMSNSI